MSEVQVTSMSHSVEPQPIPEKNQGTQTSSPDATNLTSPSTTTRPRNSYIHQDTLSPVDQNGSFAFDRVLKSGFVQKRTRKTKAWKQIYLVLRPMSLSIYKDQNEAKLRHKIQLADLTAVAILKDPKQKRQNVFGLFSPSRNYHLEAPSKKDAEEWVNLIRKEARIEEEEEELLLSSPPLNMGGFYGSLDSAMNDQSEQEHNKPNEAIYSSSPEPLEHIPQARRPSGLGGPRRQSRTFDYSGNEMASHSDLSDIETRSPGTSQGRPREDSTDDVQTGARPTLGSRNVSQASGLNAELDSERVIWQGYILYLRSKGGVRQWKDLWAVIRPRNFALYKNESEYSPVLIIPFESVINAVEIDPLSKSKRNCMQVITEEKTYKFCAHNEDTLDKSLGALKSLLAKRKETEMKAQRASMQPSPN
ncbi:hypothetical protein F5884DRAFT_713391 [Xylogone sp. PMI_703]|nr:hypothetical protein F5884DRAFT_713391 [Xylogone sp. PMI_703]